MAPTVGRGRRGSCAPRPASSVTRVGNTIEVVGRPKLHLAVDALEPGVRLHLHAAAARSLSFFSVSSALPAWRSEYDPRRVDGVGRAHRALREQAGQRRQTGVETLHIAFGPYRWRSRSPRAYRPPGRPSSAGDGPTPGCPPRRASARAPCSRTWHWTSRRPLRDDRVGVATRRMRPAHRGPGRRWSGREHRLAGRGVRHAVGGVVPHGGAAARRVERRRSGSWRPTPSGGCRRVVAAVAEPDAARSCPSCTAR